jgi:MFS family permease
VSRVRPDHGPPDHADNPAAGGRDAGGRPPGVRPRPSFWRELTEGLVYVWQTPRVLAVMWLAFLVNLTAYPVTHGLLPYLAREVYSLDEIGLGQLVAGYAAGALTGSLLMAWTGGSRHSARLMLVGVLVWYALLFVLSRMEAQASGMPVLMLIGLVQASGMVSMSVTLLRTVTARFRGRVMGVRTLAIYGLPVGLMAAGGLIDWLGYPSAITAYAITGIAFTALIGVKWRNAIWRERRGGQPNQRSRPG